MVEDRQGVGDSQFDPPSLSEGTIGSIRERVAHIEGRLEGYASHRDVDKLEIGVEQKTSANLRWVVVTLISAGIAIFSAFAMIIGVLVKTFMD